MHLTPVGSDEQESEQQETVATIPNASGSLDNPVWHALTNQHASIALGNAWARRYPPDVAPFASVAGSDTRSFDVPILHVVRGNNGAISLYEALGFRKRVELTLQVLQRR